MRHSQITVSLLLALAVLTAACYEATPWEAIGGAPADSDPDDSADPVLAAWDPLAGAGPGLCALECVTGLDCPGGQWCCGGDAAMCLADQLLPDTETAVCPLDSGWPCTCLDIGGTCADGSACVQAPAANEPIGVCRPTCWAAADCPAGPGWDLPLCVLPD